jgi:hypothetical protein
MNDAMPDSLAEPKRLLTLLNVGQTQSDWMPGELGAILAHQLNVPLREMIAGANDARSLAQVLADSNPDVNVLASLKDTFKLASTQPNDALPKEVATVLYIAVIVVAQRAGMRLTSLDDGALAERVAWALNRRWLDSTVRELLSSRCG